jgi:hypothetical protein
MKATPLRRLGLSSFILHPSVPKKSVKQADKPDSVQVGCPTRDRHSSGLQLALKLGATYPPAPRATSTLAYLVLLRAEIARFTRCGLHPQRVAVRFGLAPEHALSRAPSAFADASQNTHHGLGPQ